jgi:hypothetical protein
MRKRPTLTAKRYLRTVNRELKSALARAEPPRTMLLGGPTGVGKSTFWRDVASILGCRLVVEDLSIKVPGDLGIPRIDEDSGRHWFTQPPWWPEPGAEIEPYLEKYGRTPSVPKHLKDANKGLKWPKGKIGLIVVLEELCRSNEALLAGAMNMLLDHTLNYNQAPSWVWFVSTTNWAEDGYRGIELDRAQEERLLVADFKPTVGEWARFSEERCCPGVVAFFKSNAQYLRVKDDPNVASDEDERVPLRTATRIGETLKHLSSEEIRECGLDLVRQYVADKNIAARLVDASMEVKAGGTVSTPVTAERLLSDESDAWEAFEEALAEKNIGLIDTVLDGFPDALAGCEGEEPPQTADRLIDLLDDERVQALAAKLVHASTASPEIEKKVENWQHMYDRTVDAKGIDESDK